MKHSTLPVGVASLLPVTLLIASCGADEPPQGPPVASAAVEAPALFRYNREYVFVAESGDPVAIAPFAFRATDDASGQLQRTSQGWLARGSTWDRFLEETGATTRVGGVWRVVPQGALRVIAGGPAEIETFRFASGERRLRLDLEEPVSDWYQGGETRFRLLSGRLAVGAETLEGPVLEVLRVERMTDDGWPIPEEGDAIFLTSGDSLQLVLAESSVSADAHAWVRTPSGDRTLTGGQIDWVEMQPYEAARRDIPVRWSLQVAEMGLVGEVEAVGFDVLLGPERSGRRAVEIRYSVVGSIELLDGTIEVAGMIRHTQQ